MVVGGNVWQRLGAICAWQGVSVVGACVVVVVYAWQGVCMVGCVCMAGGMCGGGVHGGGACMAGGMCGRGPCMCGRRDATAVGGTHPTGMHSCFWKILNPFSLVFFTIQANKGK